MNENLNLVEILKDCPKGTKLYYTVYGEVEFDHVAISCEYPIVLKLKGLGGYDSLTPEGKTFDDGECLLFPSKDQRDWSKFNPKKDWFVPICEFKDGDILATNSGLQVFILEREKNDEEGSCYIGYSSGLNDIFFCGEFKFARLATEEERQKLFDAIKERGYKWNAETKTLEKFVEPKFNQNILRPFDKVLVRDYSTIYWNCDLFSRIDDSTSNHKFITISSAYRFCIPYNEETKHLIGTTEEAPEYYRYWENEL